MSRGKHMRSMEQVVKWVMWIYGSGGLGLAPQDNRFGSQQKVEMEILQRKCTKWKKNRKWQNLPIILKFLRIPHLNPKWKEGFFSYFSFCWHMLIFKLYFQVPMYSLLSWRFIVCLCRMLWVTTKHFFVPLSLFKRFMAHMVLLENTGNLKILVRNTRLLALCYSWRWSIS